MKKLLLVLTLLIALRTAADATDIVIGESMIVGFNPSGAPADVTVNLNVTNGLTAASCVVANCLQQSWVGMGGATITIGGVNYEVATVADRSNLVLSTNYLGSTGPTSTIWRKYVELRIYNTGPPFTPFGETYVVQQGTPGSSAWFRRYAARIINNGSQNVAFIPETVLPATTNASPATARYQAGLYTPSGSLVQSYPGCVTQWRLSSATTPTSWSQVCLFNSPPPPPPIDPPAYYTRTQIDARFPSCVLGQGIYYAATGNVQNCLTFNPTDFSIAGGIISNLNPFSRIQEEGVNLPQQTTLNFIGSAYTAADDPGNLRTNVTADSDLNALASNAVNGIWARTGTGTGSARTLQQPAAGITITNPAGTAGDPTFVLANDLAGLEGLGTTGLPARTAADTWAVRTLAQPAAGITITNPGGVAGNPTFVLANDLAALEGLSVAGFAARTAADTWASRTLQQPAAGITITNPAGTAGDPTFVLANDLAGLEGLAGNGVAVRTGTSTWTTRTITGTTDQITVTNGDGVAGNPTLALATGIHRTIHRDSVTVGNVGGGEDTLHSFTVPANTLPANNDLLEMVYGGVIAQNATGGNTRRIRIRWAGILIYDSGAFTWAAGGTRNFSLWARIIRLSSTSLLLQATIDSTALQTTVLSSSSVQIGAFGGLDFTIGNLLAVTAESAGGTPATDDVTQILSIITLVR